VENDLDYHAGVRSGAACFRALAYTENNSPSIKPIGGYMNELEELRAKNERLVEALRAAAKRFYNPAYGILDKDAHDECMRVIEENRISYSSADREILPPAALPAYNKDA
jgi:hypothetical protein